MLDGKSWNYHTDWFGVLDVVHTLLFGGYIEITDEGKSWALRQKFRRYHQKDVWEPLFEELLNIEGDAACPAIVDKTIAVLSKLVAENANVIFKEADELETLMSNEIASNRK